MKWSKTYTHIIYIIYIYISTSTLCIFVSACTPSNTFAVLHRGDIEAKELCQEDYNSATAAYLSAPQRLKPDLQWKYYEARMMDMARQGSWLIFCIFLVFCVYYILTYLYVLLLKPFLSPILFALGDCCCKKKKVEEDSATWETCLKECEKHNVLTSYALNMNTKYHAAAVAIAHGDDQAKKQAEL